jgi:uncharacterized membrane protein YhhN
MINLWLVLTLLCAVFDWIAIVKKWTVVGYLTKPGVMLLLLAWFSSLDGWRSGLSIFGVALIFSLVGDILLLLPDRFFLAGVLAFMIVQVSYVFGLRSTHLPSSLLVLTIGISVVLVGSILFGILRKSLVEDEVKRKLEWPMMIYLLAICMMLYSSVLTLFSSDWLSAAAGLIALGGILFFISDTLLVINRFIKPFQNARLCVRICYHAGQFGLIAGVLLNVFLRSG